MGMNVYVELYALTDVLNQCGCFWAKLKKEQLNRNRKIDRKTLCITVICESPYILSAVFQILL